VYTGAKSVEEVGDMVEAVQGGSFAQMLHAVVVGLR